VAGRGHRKRQGWVRKKEKEKGVPDHDALEGSPFHPAPGQRRGRAREAGTRALAPGPWGCDPEVAGGDTWGAGMGRARAAAA
jgi:hypothetical protein